MSEIDALFGLDTPDEEKLRMLAANLREQKRAADIFSISPTFAPQAQQEQQNILQSAKQAGVLKKALEERNLKEQEGRLNRANALKAAMIRASGRNQNVNPWGGIKTDRERKKFEETAEQLNQFDTLADSWKEEYGPSLQVPGMGTLENVAGRYLPFTGALNEQVNWWGMWEEIHNLVQRHKFFGSAFTKTEKEAWGKAFFNENTRPELITKRLDIMRLMKQIMAEDQITSAAVKNVSPQMIEQKYGGFDYSGMDVNSLVNLWMNDREGWYERRQEQKRLLNSMIEGTKAEENGEESLAEKAERILRERGAIE